MQCPRGESLQLPTYGGGQFISSFHKGILHVKLFWDLRRAEFHKVKATNYLNLDFLECLIKSQIPTPNSGLLSPAPLWIKPESQPF